jgi:hypothetical protein
MATTSIQESSIQGSLYELVARGNKDKYFVRDISDSYHPYSGRYSATVPFICERRTTVPLNGPTFGNTFEIALEPYGDILTEVGLLIELPTWFPELPLFPNDINITDPRRVNSYYWIKDTSGNSYGYVNCPAYFMFERIQFYQDQILVQEWSGDALLATNLTEGSWNSEFLDLALAGQVGNLGKTDGRSIALRATPGKLRLRLPTPGCQTLGDPGFPLCCMTNQNFRFRIKLRPLEQLIVGVDASGLPLLNPQPWAPGKVFEYLQDGSLTPYQFNPIGFTSLAKPNILLETVQAYVPIEVKDELRSKHISIAFRRQFENIFTFGPLDYAPFDRGADATNGPIVTRRLDGRHPTERIIYFFRNQGCSAETNRLDDFTNPIGSRGGQFYSEMKLVIAGQDREYMHPAFVWSDCNAYAKDERDTGLNIGEMRWSLGDVYERVRPTWRQPEGAVNMTTADKPTLHIQLENVLPGSIGKRVEMRAICEGWAAYEVEGGRGRLLFAN